jgi:DNA modification methylase
MKTEMVATKEIIPYARNPRKNEDAIAKVSASLKEYGWQQPIVVDAEMVIIAGHTRLEAAKRLKMEKVPIHIADKLTEAQVKAFRIADNRVSQEAEWDMDLLKIELGDLEGLEFDLSLTGFDDDELNALMIEAVEEGLTDDDEVPEAPENPVSVLGDVWTLGNHRLMCGDSTSVDAVDKLMDGNLAQTFFTDPPYGDNVGGLETKKSSEKIKGKGLVKRVSFIKNDKDIDWLEDVFNIVPTFLEKENTKMVFFKWDRLEQIKQMASAFGEPSALCVWDRVRKASAFFRFQPQHELCLHWGNQSDKKDKSSLSNVWRVPKELENKELHPTVKPLGILEPVIGVTTSPSKIVLDLFGGSGSTLIACEKTGRHCRMMELDETYVDTIICRWQDFTGNQAVHAETGKTYNEMKAERDGGK